MGKITVFFSKTRTLFSIFKKGQERSPPRPHYLCSCNFFLRHTVVNEKARAMKFGVFSANIQRNTFIYYLFQFRIFVANFNHWHFDSFMSEFVYSGRVNKNMVTKNLRQSNDWNVSVCSIMIYFTCIHCMVSVLTFFRSCTVLKANHFQSIRCEKSWWHTTKCSSVHMRWQVFIIIVINKIQNPSKF